MSNQDYKQNLLTEWVVARLNYAEPQEELLTKSLKPFVNSLVQANIVERYFWHRSPDRGAHILLTMRAENRVLHEIVLPNLNEHFARFIEDKPSTRPVDEAGFEPNNSLQTTPYQPNIEIWGGAVGLPIMERFQQASSDAVLSFMATKSENWNSVEVLATAIQMHLGFVDSAGMKVDEAAQFFEFCLMTEFKEKFPLQLFEYIFKKQAEPLTQFHGSLWNLLQSGELFAEQHYNRWLEQCYFCAEDLKLTFRRRTLDVEPRFASLWKLYARLLRSTNQRLGLSGRHEALVFYAMMRSLEKLCPPVSRISDALITPNL